MNRLMNKMELESPKNRGAKAEINGKAHARKHKQSPIKLQNSGTTSSKMDLDFQDEKTQPPT